MGAPADSTTSAFIGEARMKFLCSLPEIERSLLGVVKTLAALVQESEDRETRLKHRIYELSTQVKDLKENSALRKNHAVMREGARVSRPVGCDTSHLHRHRLSANLVRMKVLATGPPGQQEARRCRE